jgi:hypothetical protein
VKKVKNIKQSKMLIPDPCQLIPSYRLAPRPSPLATISRRLFLALLFVFLAASPVLAASLSTLLPSDTIAELRGGKEPALVQFKDPLPAMTPGHAGVKALQESIRAELEPSVMVETLFLYAKPAGASRPEWSAAEKTALFNKALELSTLAGIEYYSASRGVMRTFYETSVVIDDPDERNPIPDPVFAVPPAELTVYARQKDLTFGNNVYQYDYRVFPDALVFTQENLTTMTYSIIPAVRRNRLRSMVAVFDADDDLLIYVCSMAKTASLPAIRDRIGNSFSNRAEAILTWFSGQADKAFRR